MREALPGAAPPGLPGHGRPSPAQARGGELGAGPTKAAQAPAAFKRRALNVKNRVHRDSARSRPRPPSSFALNPDVEAELDAVPSAEAQGRSTSPFVHSSGRTRSASVRPCPRARGPPHAPFAPRYRLAGRRSASMAHRAREPVHAAPAWCRRVHGWGWDAACGRAACRCRRTWRRPPPLRASVRAMARAPRRAYCDALWALTTGAGRRGRRGHARP